MFNNTYTNKMQSFEFFALFIVYHSFGINPSIGLAIGFIFCHLIFYKE